MDESELIGRILQGEKELYEALVKRYHDLAYARAYSVLFSRQDAEEIAQESLIAAYLALGTLRDRAKFGHWLSGIVRRKTVYFLRKKVKKSEIFEGLYENLATSLVEEQSYESPDAKQLALERQKIIAEEIASLPDKYREVIYMRYYRNCSYQEIGDFLGLTKSGVDTRLQRARAQLMRKLKARGISDEM